jgi:hypothetical protein
MYYRLYEIPRTGRWLAYRIPVYLFLIAVPVLVGSDPQVPWQEPWIAASYGVLIFGPIAIYGPAVGLIIGSLWVDIVAPPPTMVDMFVGILGCALLVGGALAVKWVAQLPEMLAPLPQSMRARERLKSMIRESGPIHAVLRGD